MLGDVRQFLENCPVSQMEKSDIDLIVAATMDNIMMVEGEMDEVSEEEMLEAIKVAHDAIKVHCKVQEELAAEVGVVKREYCHEVNNEELKAKVEADLFPACYDVAKQQIQDKQLRIESFHKIQDDYIEKYEEANAENEEIDLEQDIKLIKRYFHKVEGEAMRRMILDEGIRLDGRKTDEIRPIWGEVDYLPGAHGSAIFTRGETQSLSSITLESQ